MADDVNTPALISRKDAQAKGLQRYCTGRPCKRGHIGERYTGDRKCVTCEEERRRTPEYKEMLRIAVQHYASTERGKENRRARGRRYFRTEKGRATIARNEATPRRKAYKKAYIEWYYPIYRKTEIGRENRRVAEENRRARKLGNGGELSSDDIVYLRKTQKKCYLCGKRFTKNNPATIDHIIPLCKGGRNDITNVMLACDPCNVGKKDKILQLL